MCFVGSDNIPVHSIAALFGALLSPNWQSEQLRYPPMWNGGIITALCGARLTQADIQCDDWVGVDALLVCALSATLYEVV